jgi:hypothetical protein
VSEFVVVGRKMSGSYTHVKINTAAENTAVHVHKKYLNFVFKQSVVVNAAVSQRIKKNRIQVSNKAQARLIITRIC